MSSASPIASQGTAIGKVGEDAHDKALSKYLEEEKWYREQLSPVYRQSVEFHRLFLARREDKRLSHEKWRSWSWSSWLYSATQTKQAALSDIMNAIDPAVQAEGVSQAQVGRAQAFERTMDYVMRGNRWPYTQEMALLNAIIQGWTVLKLGWRDLVWPTTQRASMDERKAFDTSVNEAQKLGVPSPPEPGTADFEQWMNSAKQVYPGLKPLQGIHDVDTVKYRGPWVFRPSDYDLRYDPFVEDWANDMDVVYHRIVKTKEWLEGQTGAEDRFPYDPGQVASAIDKGAGGSGSGDDGRRLTTWDRQEAEALGLSVNDNDPRYRNSVELLERWAPREKFPYCVILNRHAIINKRCDTYPFWHRQLPFIPIHNAPLAGRAIGMSDYTQVARTFKDMITFRDLSLDALLLAVLPIFLKTRGLGLPEIQRQLTPGGILDVNDVNGFKKAWEAPGGFAELLRTDDLLKNELDTGMSTWGNIRGAQAQIGRVSASEAQGRLQQGLNRNKQVCIRMEEEFNPIIPQSLFLLYQKWPKAEKLPQRIVGADGLPDPFQGMTPDHFIEGLTMDIKFRGATRTLNRELQAQQLINFLKEGTSVELAPGVKALLPSEVREILRRIAEALGQKGIDQIVTKDGDALMGQVVQAIVTNVQVQTVQGQKTLEQLNAPPAPPPTKPPSESLNYKDAPPDVKRQIEAQAGLQPSQIPEPVVAQPAPRERP
jgi:hypothetical protein